MRRLITSAVCFWCMGCFGQIPSDRVYPWSAGVNSGVVGGIPARSTIFTNLSNIDNTGETDVSASMSAAIAACPSNQVVYLPAGTYRVDSAVLGSDSDDGVTLRGAGIGVTTIKSKVSSGYAAIAIGSSDWPVPTPAYSIVSGATAGSSNAVVASTSGISLGNMVRIGQSSPDYVFNTGAATNIQHSMHLVTGTNATTVTFWPPLPLSLTNSPTIAVYSKVVSGFGVEDLTVNLSESSVAAIYALQWWGGWIKGVEVTGSNTRQLYLNNFNGGEVRDCYTHGTRSSGPGHEGIDLYNLCCWNLVENNTCANGGFPAIILGDGEGGCVGNVVAYNWVDSIDSGTTVSGAAISVNHGPHNMFNLFEGNVCQLFQSDGYFGSSSHNTLFRNNFTGTFASSNIWWRAVDLCRWSYWFNVVGNVLGSSGGAFTYSTTNNGFADPLIYRLGFPNMGNMGYTGSNPPATNWAGLDSNVEQTILTVANYDYATAGVVSPTNGLASSMYRDTKPSWMAGYAWPAIGSDLSPMVSVIPAQARLHTATVGTVNVGTLIISP